MSKVSYHVSSSYRKSLPAQERLALFVIAHLAMDGDIAYDDIHNDKATLTLMMESVAESIATALPLVDFTEICRLCKPESDPK